MTGRRHSHSATDPFSLGMDMMMLGLDSAMVIGMRTIKIAAGGAAARKESEDMVSEKIMAMLELPMKLATSGTLSPAKLTKSTLRHYSKKVRANRKRLSETR